MRMPTRENIHLLPLQQLTIRLKETRRSERESIIKQLEMVLARLKGGELKGSAQDDEHGFSFEYSWDSIGHGR